LDFKKILNFEKEILVFANFCCENNIFAKIGIFAENMCFSFFAKNIRNFRDNFRENKKFSQNEKHIFSAKMPIFAKMFAEICPFSHDFRIFAKTEKCSFVSTLLITHKTHHI
jgi:hypothetical protein